MCGMTIAANRICADSNATMSIDLSKSPAGVWTAGIANDFEYRNNVVAKGEFVWIGHGAQSLQAPLQQFAGRAGGSFLELIATKRMDQAIELAMDESERNYPHTSGGDAARICAELFMKPLA